MTTTDYTLVQVKDCQTGEYVTVSKSIGTRYKTRMIRKAEKLACERKIVRVVWVIADAEKKAEFVEWHS